MPNRIHVWFLSGSDNRFSTAGWIRAATRFPYAHVAVGYDSLALNPTGNGNDIWPLYSFVDTFRPQVAFSVTAKYPLSWDNFSILEDRCVKTRWRSLVSWLTGGKYLYSEDCVQTVCRALRLSGIDVPRLVTPRQLYEWLSTRGFPSATRP